MEVAADDSTNLKQRDCAQIFASVKSTFGAKSRLLAATMMRHFSGEPPEDVNSFIHRSRTATGSLTRTSYTINAT